MKSAWFRVSCLVVAFIAVAWLQQPAYAQRGGHGGGGFHGGGGGFHGSSIGSFHGGGFRGGFGGGHFAGYRGGGYRGWGGRGWGYPHYGWGWGWGWGLGFGLGLGWPYWWGYPYGYYSPWWYDSYPYDYQYYCPPGYPCSYYGYDDSPSADSRPSPRPNANGPARPWRPPVPGSGDTTYNPNSNIADLRARARVLSVDHITDTPGDYRTVQSATRQDPPITADVQSAMRALREMPPFARQREIETGRYSHFSPEQRELLKSVN